jgi:hypothetical protein
MYINDQIVNSLIHILSIEIVDNDNANINKFDYEKIIWKFIWK